MLNRLNLLWQNHKLLLLAFILAAAATLMFAVRLVVVTLYFSNPTHQNQPLEGWMTPRYLAYSYDLTADELEQVLGIDPSSVSRIHLKNLLKDQGITLQELQSRLDTIKTRKAAE
ncbi:hypothetical protein [Profundibacter amoris]|uniref:Uncharacterized protein n=1 Tax=Profundibacter amoris TaxID=2171755 RepID=A0A347UH48_9RHOB|nr:hypothetical protein [Profundibacter amoris]AXX98176.1 hypothetical protein BAR1_09680 [Profundibacter amoris]